MIYSTSKYLSILDLCRYNSGQSDHSAAGSGFHSKKTSFSSTDSEFSI